MKPNTGGPFCAVPRSEQHLMRATKTEQQRLASFVDVLFQHVADLQDAMCDSYRNFVVDTHGLTRAATLILKDANSLLSIAGTVESAGVDAEPPF